MTQLPTYLPALPPAAARAQSRTRGARWALLTALGTALALMVASGYTATLPAGFTEALVARELSDPTAMQFAPDGRLFVCEQGGALRVIKNGQLLPAPFVDLNVSSAGERGLLGIAFDPAFASNRFVYLYYTARSPAVHNRVSRFTASGDTAAPGSEVILHELNNLSGATNHNGGALHFGEDGMLYIATGDNADGSNAQTLSNRLGKILRIRRDGSIPTDNPFFTRATGANRAIWALGLRNPFTFAFQPESARMYINDVGQNTWEEINEGLPGANYGWPQTEGPTSDARFRSPVFSYGHGSGNTLGCAITGGAFYNPPVPQYPAAFVGDYFFADFCGGWIRRLHPDGSVSPFVTGINGPVDLKIGPDAQLYYLARGAGAVYRIRHGTDQPPSFVRHPVPVTVRAGEEAAFSIAATGTGPLSYQWQRNRVNIPGATTASYRIPAVVLQDNGARFRCVVTNPHGSATSSEALLTVTTDRPPVPTIRRPATGSLYRAGARIRYLGSAADPEDGTLPGRAFTWKVDFHHDDHVHPFLPARTGSRTGSFRIPRTGETSPNVFYRITLTVRDSAGQAASQSVDIRPRTARLGLDTRPTGLQVTLDGQPRTTPDAVVSVAGMHRTLGAPSPQTLDGVTYRFVSWSDGGRSSHRITSPSSDRTYTAKFRAVSGE